MSRCLNLSRAGEYAIAALSRLSLEAEGGREWVRTRTLARLQAIPPSFLVKILSRCARAGLVRTGKGPSGGVALARPPEGISLLEVIEACEGRLARQQCVFYQARTCSGPDCPVFCPLREEEERTRASLAGTTLAPMIEALRTHPGPGAA